MPKNKAPQITVTHHRVEPPKYSKLELEGLKDQALRLAKHIDILQEEIKSKQSQLIGLESVIKENATKL